MGVSIRQEIEIDESPKLQQPEKDGEIVEYL